MPFRVGNCTMEYQHVNGSSYLSKWCQHTVYHFKHAHCSIEIQKGFSYTFKQCMYPCFLLFLSPSIALYMIIFTLLYAIFSQIQMTLLIYQCSRPCCVNVMYFWNINEVIQWERLSLKTQSFNTLKVFNVTTLGYYLFTSTYDSSWLCSMQNHPVWDSLYVW